MVRAKSYTPTNKRFQRHFQDIAKTATRKGHLTQGEREQEDVVTERGILVRINKSKFNEDGWEVEVGTGEDKKTYNCTNATGQLAIPDSIESAQYFTPKETTNVDVLIDNVSKIYSITKIRSLNMTFVSDINSIKIGFNENNSSKSQDGQIVINRNEIQINKTVSVDGDIQADNVKQLEERVKELEDKIRPLIKDD